MHRPERRRTEASSRGNGARLAPYPTGKRSPGSRCRGRSRCPPGPLGSRSLFRPPFRFDCLLSFRWVRGPCAMRLSTCGGEVVCSLPRAYQFTTTSRYPAAGSSCLGACAPAFSFSFVFRVPSTARGRSPFVEERHRGICRHAERSTEQGNSCALTDRIYCTYSEFEIPRMRCPFPSSDICRWAYGTNVPHCLVSSRPRADSPQL